MKQLAQNVASKRVRKMHAVLLLIPCGSLQDENDMGNLRKQLANLIKEKINPIVLLARVDEQIPGIRKAPLADTKEFTELRAMAARKFNLPSASIFPCVPYTDERERVFDIDRLAFMILEVALNSARNHVTFQMSPEEKTGPKVVSPSKAPVFSPFPSTPEVSGRKSVIKIEETSPPKVKICKACDENVVNASIIHDDSQIHLVCCFECAQNLQEAGLPCPQCQKPFRAVARRGVK